MACRVLYPSLPDLLRKTILTFCEGSVQFNNQLEVLGSVHVRSDNKKVATFLLDEIVSRDDVSRHNGIVGIHMTPDGKWLVDNGQSHSESNQPDKDSTCSVSAKKPRKILKPVRKQNCDFSDSSDDEDVGYESRTSIEHNSESQENMQLSPQAHVSTSNSHNGSSQSPEIYSKSSGETSPHGSMSYEVTSTKPDEMLATVAISPRSVSPEEDEKNLSQHEQSQQDQNNNASDAMNLKTRKESPAEEEYPLPSKQIKYEGIQPMALSNMQYVTSNAINGMIDLSKRSAKALLASTDTETRSSAGGSLHQPFLPSSPLSSSQSPWFANIHPFLQFSPTAPSNIVSLPMAMPLGLPPIMSVPSPLETVTTSTTSSSQPTVSNGNGESSSWDKTIPCRICGRMLKSDRMLELHMNTAHTHKTVYPCKQCGKKFYAASSLHSHKKRKHTSWEQKLKCPYCPRSYAFQSELLRHVDLAHFDVFRKTRQNSGMSSAHIPANVPPVLQSQSRTLPISYNGSHIDTSPTEPQKPALSPEIIKQEKNREENEENAEETADVENGDDDSGKVRLQCQECGLSLKSKECLALHMNAKHTQENAYPCHICGKVFYAPSSRFCHVRRVHTAMENKFRCSVCQKIFTFHYELRNHMKMMHHGVKDEAVSPQSAHIASFEDASNGEPLALKAEGE